MDKIRICRIITRLNIGGPAQHVILLSAGLPREEFETLLVIGKEEEGEGSLFDLAMAKGCQPFLLPRLHRPIGLLDDLLTLVALFRLFKRWKPHIVHTHTSKAGTLGRLAARAAGVLIVVHTFHGHIFEGYFSPWQATAFLTVERLLAKFTTRIITLSEGQRRELLARKIGNEEKIVVLPLGLELDPFSACAAKSGQLREELGLLGEEKLVGIVGRLVPIKGHEIFLQAARVVAERLPSCRFLIVGDGPERLKLQGMAEALGLSSEVLFLGWRRDLDRIYADLDLCTLSSSNEGTPVSIIEAMAAGVPVVATQVGGVKDLVTHHETGLLVPPGDAQALASAILTLLNDPEKAQRMARAAKARAYPFYDVKALLSRMSDFYHTLVGQDKRRSDP
ncbi:MAG: GT4 family glycosyltransferase PelF [candidate division NC10 bacterium]|nr:GT4 family glycosyltransferase PelF [candidate division NC10 bacterium]